MINKQYDNIYEWTIFMNRRFFSPISPCELKNYKLINYNNDSIKSFNILIKKYVKNGEIILISSNNINYFSKYFENDKSYYKYILKISKNRMIQGYYTVQKIRYLNYSLFMNEFTYYLNNKLVVMDHIYKKYASDSFYYVLDIDKIKNLIILIMLRKKLDIKSILNIISYFYVKSNDIFFLENKVYQ